MAARFFESVLTCPVATQPTLDLVEGLVPGVKLLGYGVDHLPSYSTEGKEKVEL